MAAIHSKNTVPEITLRRALWAKGLRFRVQYGKEKIDIAFPTKKVAVFVDGCFWHGCPEHATWPIHNADFWREKIEANRRRDRDTDNRLATAGWRVVHVWEHEDFAVAADKIERLVRVRNSGRRL